MEEPEGPRRSPRPEWTPLPRPGCTGVAGRVLLAAEGVHVALLKFDPQGTIDEHSAGHEIDVVALEGEGFISIEHRVYAFRAGDTLRWPRGLAHRLWTAEHALVALMLEWPEPRS